MSVCRLISDKCPKGYQEKLFAEENITARPGTLNLCIDTPADISFQENASKREQAQARTDLAECPILKTLDDEVSVAKRAFSTAERAGLPPEVCTLASSGAVAALNSKSPRHVCDVICKVSALASGISEENTTLASSHALCVFNKKIRILFKKYQKKLHQYFKAKRM